MANAGQVVQGFMGALGKGDFSAARKFLHENLSFRGPIDAFDKPEPYLQAMEKLHKMVERVDMKKMFIDGNDVCLLYDLVTNTPAGTSFVCEWMQVKGERLRRSESSSMPAPSQPCSPERLQRKAYHTPKPRTENLHGRRQAHPSHQ